MRNKSGILQQRHTAVVTSSTTVTRPFSSRLACAQQCASSTLLCNQHQDSMHVRCYSCILLTNQNQLAENLLACDRPGQHQADPTNNKQTHSTPGHKMNVSAETWKTSCSHYPVQAADVT
jgi:hypothetical protein